MAVDLASIQGISELLRAVQNPDSSVRQAGDAARRVLYYYSIVSPSIVW